LNPYPDNSSVFDVFFDLKNNNWADWETAIKEFSNEQFLKIPKTY